MSSIEELKHMKIPLEDISSATNGFAEDTVIAKGGFGKVYRGISEKHGIVAIKQLVVRARGQGDREFQTEIILHSKYKHKNIASLCGFCEEDGEKILVYKYESNESLDKHLNNTALTWIRRLRICLDAARGLRYLHDEVEPHQRVLHRDVKSANILLDDDWNAKISDFGLSKIGPANMASTFLISNACGTYGYIDPEFFYSGHLTQKSDVFSFGVVLFEVLCGRTACVQVKEDGRPIFYVMVQKHFKKQTLDKIIHSDLRKQIDETSLLTFSTVAYQCLMSGEERPTMKTVVEKLEKALNNQLLASQRPLPDAHHQGQSGTTATSHSALTTSFQSRKYDVFLSFRSSDTSKTFVDHLYIALTQQGINTYKDDETLSRGELIGQSLLKAIDESHIALIVFSRNYADSSWCLDELAYIMKCREMRGQIVIPVFYDVDPSEVRKQKRVYGEALGKHELFENNKVELWRKALVYASNLVGWESQHNDNGNEKFIQQIVYTISHELLRLKESAEESASTNLIGIETRIQDLKPLLELRSGGVRMVGICGIWGSGKSTLVSSLYDEIIYEFEGCCFVKNVCAESRMYGLKALQEKILSDVLKSKMKLKDIEEGIYMMKRRLCNNKVLIVLDNVDHIDHLKMLAGSLNWFGDGSRIIITTRNQELLNAYNVNIIHTVRMLDVNEAINLFSTYAFGAGQSVKSSYEKVSRDIISKLGGHPSSLINLGSFLHGKDMSEWLNTLSRLKGIPIDEILEKFEVGDDGVIRDIFSRFVS